MASGNMVSTASFVILGLAVSSVLGASGASDPFGPAFITGPVSSSSGAFILETVSTLIVPPAPNPIIGDVALWVGMDTDKGDLIQGIVDNSPANGGEGCATNLGTKWCSMAYTLVDAYRTQQPVWGTDVVVNPGSRVTMHYKYNNATQKYDQDIAVNGTIISTLSSSKGHKAIDFQTAVECATTRCGTVPPHTWVDTVITFSKPDPNYGKTLVGHKNASGGTLKTTDGGKTWTMDTIQIPQHKFDA